MQKESEFKQQLQKAIFEKYPQCHDLKRQWELAHNITAILKYYIKEAENPIQKRIDKARDPYERITNKMRFASEYKYCEQFRRQLSEGLDEMA